MPPYTVGTIKANARHERLRRAAEGVTTTNKIELSDQSVTAKRGEQTIATKPAPPLPRRAISLVALK